MISSRIVNDVSYCFIVFIDKIWKLRDRMIIISSEMDCAIVFYLLALFVTLLYLSKEPRSMLEKLFKLTEHGTTVRTERSEERRVGKECRL